MKRVGATITVGDKTIIYSKEIEERLTAHQKYTIFLTLLGCMAFLGFLYILFG